MKLSIVLILFLLLPLPTVYAGEADVVKVEVSRLENGTYNIAVTVSHKDEGWGHYVDYWDIVTSDGTVLGTRTLYHPHVQEQPFTRSLSGVKFPEGTNKMTVRAHDSVHEYGGKVFAIELSQ